MCIRDRVYSMVDLAIIGQFMGSAGTVGVGTGGEIADLGTTIAVAFAAAGQIYIAQLAGAKDDKRIKEMCIRDSDQVFHYIVLPSSG